MALNKILKTLIFMLVGAFVGGSYRARLYRFLFNANIARTATIGLSIIDADEVHIGERASIGHFTIIRNLENLTLEKDAKIGTFNWIFGSRTRRSFAHRPERRSALLLGEGAGLVSRHIVDCTDTVRIGKMSLVAGYRSQILTHSVSIAKGRQDCAEVRIGNYCFVGTGAILLKGATLADKSVLAAGSVLLQGETQSGMLYAGNPAKSVRTLALHQGFFSRKDAFIR